MRFTSAALKIPPLLSKSTRRHLSNCNGTMRGYSNTFLNKALWLKGAALDIFDLKTYHFSLFVVRGFETGVATLFALLPSLSLACRYDHTQTTVCVLVRACV